MIAARFALMKVSPSQASPRMPMIAVRPDWQVLHLGTSATGAGPKGEAIGDEGRYNW
jgi:hypothetical protein